MTTHNHRRADAVELADFPCPKPGCYWYQGDVWVKAIKPHAPPTFRPGPGNGPTHIRKAFYRATLVTLESGARVWTWKQEPTPGE